MCWLGRQHLGRDGLNESLRDHVNVLDGFFVVAAALLFQNTSKSLPFAARSGRCSKFSFLNIFSKTVLFIDPWLVLQGSFFLGIAVIVCVFFLHPFSIFLIFSVTSFSPSQTETQKCQ